MDEEVISSPGVDRTTRFQIWLDEFRLRLRLPYRPKAEVELFKRYEIVRKRNAQYRVAIRSHRDFLRHMSTMTGTDCEKAYTNFYIAHWFDYNVNDEEAKGE